MRFILSCLYIALLSLNMPAQVFGFGPGDSEKPTTGDQVLQQMYKKYGNQAYCQRYTFSQKNTHYRNDSVTGHSEWYEAIEFPDKFRIDFGDTTSGNFVLFKNDSSYSYRKGQLVKIKYNSNSLLLLLGGMYYRTQADAISRLKKEHYNTDIISEQQWNGASVYVVGASKDDTSSNQFWVDQKSLKVVRIIEKINETETMDMRFEAHQKLCKGYIETKVSFRRNGKLEQFEEYDHIRPVNAFPKSVFYPN